jgi:uncharacterized protein with PIN domain
VPSHPAELVPCPRCGRGYGAERFAGGRTIHCACGARVGVPFHSGVAERAGRPRFLADSMLGGLARWLRILGYDTAWEPEIDDRELVRRGVAEHRWILTRDRRLVDAWWTDNLLLLSPDDPLEQLREVAARVPLSLSRIFTRCSRCNRRLEKLPPAEAALLRPPDVTGALRRCPQCGRIYWQGSHTRRMRATLEAALGETGQ